MSKANYKIEFDLVHGATYSWSYETPNGITYEGIITYPKYERGLTDIEWNDADLPDEWEEIETRIQNSSPN